MSKRVKRYTHVCVVHVWPHVVHIVTQLRLIQSLPHVQSVVVQSVVHVHQQLYLFEEQD